MNFDYEKQKLSNYESLDNPRIGDYWQEMFCPYFLVVDVKGDDITVLSCLGGPNSWNRKDELNAKVDVKDGWTFDLGKSMVVNREWMTKTVKYDSIEGFVADVGNSEKTVAIAMEWRDYKQKQIRNQISELEKKWEEFTGWAYLKDGVKVL
jgi:hypothetical protein